MSETMYCTNCAKKMDAAADICVGCGVRQGKKISHCYNCGSDVKPEQELCIECGVNPKKVKKAPKILDASQTQSSESVNVTLAAILGFVIPGLPAVLWYQQKTKGIAMIAASVVLGILTGGLFNLVSVVIGSMDAYQLGKRVNAGESLDEWTFFWNK